jgi:hypothetical protein
LLKKFGLIAVAAVAALVMGTAILGGSQSVQAETTDVVNVHCELVDADVDVNACEMHLTETDIEDLADVIGDDDGELEASDFDEEEGYDASQLSEACTDGSVLSAPGDLTGDASWGCTMLVFVFVDDEKPVTLDTPSGLTSFQAGLVETDYICDTDGDALGLDNDCSDVVASNGDGVVVFHVLNFNAERGDEKEVNVLQEAVEQSTTLDIVGIPDDIEIALTEDVIGTSGSAAAADDCAEDTDVTEATDEPNATVAVVTLEDEDNTLLAMWPLLIAVDPPADNPAIAVLGENDSVEDITGDTLVTLDPGDGLPIAYYRVVCGGRGTGETSIEVESLTDGSTDSADLTVVGLPDDQTLSAAAATIKCDGTETSTVTAKVVDSAGNNVADGTEVTFTVVALGTANPINTTTTDGVATTVVTPLSNSSAGVTVIVTSGDVQESIRVDCSIPLVTQPTLTPAGQSGNITPPDTGNGGYLAQDGSGISMMTLVALALVGAVVAAGGTIARRAAK